jgi:hypothetical protein
MMTMLCARVRTRLFAPVRFLNQLTHFHEIWCKCYAVIIHLNVANLNFVRTVVAQ